LCGVTQQYKLLDQPYHQIFLIWQAFRHQQRQRHQGVVVDELLSQTIEYQMP